MIAVSEPCAPIEIASLRNLVPGLRDLQACRDSGARIACSGYVPREGTMARMSDFSVQQVFLAITAFGCGQMMSIAAAIHTLKEAR